MKTKNILSFLLLLIAGTIHAQSVPKGMNYQGIVRDRGGEIIADQTITFKVTIQNAAQINPAIYYSEVQRITTSKDGNFKLVIGKGSTLAGSFYLIPWNSQSIWMELAVKKDNETTYTTISKSELLAVPYAFHAGSAATLAGVFVPYELPGTAGTNGNSINATSATSWLVTGMSGTTPPTQYLGTSDAKDLVIKTSAIERMRILSTGNVNITNSLTIGNDLTVNRDATINRHIAVKRSAVVDSNLTIKRNVSLNTSSGQTINNGPFVVGNVSPSILTGRLQVDRTSNLNNGLNVNNIKPTLFTGTLRVNNATDLYNSFTVNVQASSWMTGTLRVDSDVTFKNRAFLTNFSFNSFTTADGNLVVYGGTGIGRNLFVGGNAKIGGRATLNGQVKITDPRISERIDSGALVVTGGVGIGRELKVQGAVRLYDSLRVDKTTWIEDAMVVTDSTTINASSRTNALVINNRTDFNNYLEVNDQVTINAAALSSASQELASNYPLHVRNANQGIAIKVPTAKANANNFISFWDNSSTRRGRIEGFTASEYVNSSRYQDELDRLQRDELLKGFAFAGQVVKSAIAGFKLAGALSSSTGCFGLAACVTTPIPSLIVARTVNFAAALVTQSTAEIQMIQAIQRRQDFEDAGATLSGVTYESGSGDYAEYLEMADPAESISAGNIVGMKNGKISKNTSGADRLMVVSVNPAVLGNMPPKGKETSFRKVAFLGQVPVKVSGTVQAGDYILADGNNSGMGIAKSKIEMSTEAMKNIVGVAWDNSQPGASVTTINTAVGLNQNDNSGQVASLEKNVMSLQQKIAERNEKLAKLLPEFRNEIAKPDFEILNPNTADAAHFSKSTDNIIYYHIKREQIEAGIEIALKELGTETNLPGIGDIKNNPDAKAKLIAQIEQRIKDLQSKNMQTDAKANGTQR